MRYPELGVTAADHCGPVSCLPAFVTSVQCVPDAVINECRARQIDLGRDRSLTPLPPCHLASTRSVCRDRRVRQRSARGGRANRTNGGARALVARRRVRNGRPLEHHELWLFASATSRDAFFAAGLSFAAEPSGTQTSRSIVACRRHSVKLVAARRDIVSGSDQMHGTSLRSCRSSTGQLVQDTDTAAPHLLCH